MNTFKKSPICHCDHFAPSVPEIRSLEFNHDLAARLNALDMSSAAFAEMVWTELTQHRKGKLFNAEGKRIGPDSDDIIELARYDFAVGDQRRHFVKRYKARAVDGRFRNRLQHNLVYPVSMMFLALELRDCRLFGPCGCSGLPKRHVDPIRFND